MRRFLMGTAWAGIAGPVLFTVSFLAQQALRSDDDSVAEPVSALEAGPAGWVMQVTFVVFGLLTMAHALGLHRSLAPTRGGWAGTLLLFVTGLGSVVAGVFPLDRDSTGEIYDPGGHQFGGTLFFLASAPALILLSRRVRRDARWNGLAGYVLASGVVFLVLAVVMMRFGIPEDAALHDVAGVIQRVMVVAVLFPCRVALGVRQLRCLDREPVPSAA